MRGRRFALAFIRKIGRCVVIEDYLGHEEPLDRVIQFSHSGENQRGYVLERIQRVPSFLRAREQIFACLSTELPIRKRRRQDSIDQPRVRRQLHAGCLRTCVPENAPAAHGADGQFLREISGYALLKRSVKKTCRNSVRGKRYNKPPEPSRFRGIYLVRLKGLEPTR